MSQVKNNDEAGEQLGLLAIAIVGALVAVVVLPPLIILVSAIFVLCTSDSVKTFLLRTVGVVAAGAVIAQQRSIWVRAYDDIRYYGWSAVEYTVDTIWLPTLIILAFSLGAIWGMYFVTGGKFERIGQLINKLSRRDRGLKKQVLDGMNYQDLTGKTPPKTWTNPKSSERPPALGLVTYPSDDNETLHTVIEGATGTGKTQAIKCLMAEALERGDCVIAIDGGADLFKTFEHMAGDLTRFDLMDEHDQGWWPVNEIERKADWNQIAQGLFGNGKGNGAEWTSMAKSVFAAVMNGYETACLEEGKPFENSEAFNLLISAPTEALEPFVEGTPAAGLIGNDKGMANIRMSFLDALGFFEYLPKERGEFSVRKWMQQTMHGPNMQSLFVTYKKRDLSIVKNLLSAIIELVVTTAIDEGKSDKKIWLFIDELAGLGEIPALLTGVAELRKTGVRIVVGIQDYDQIEDLYGRSKAASITNNLSNKMILRSTSPQSAKRLSETLGQQRIAMWTESKGKSQRGFGAASKNTSTNMIEKEEYLVSTTDVLNLPDLTAYVKMAGRSDVIKTPVPIYGGHENQLTDKIKALIKNKKAVFVARPVPNRSSD